MSTSRIRSDVEKLQVPVHLTANKSEDELIVGDYRHVLDTRRRRDY